MTQTAREVALRCGDLKLEGVLHLPEGKTVQLESALVPGAVVCHPHPHHGGDMDNNVVMVVCRSLIDCGCAALRFNFRGVGRSEGGFGQGIAEQDDVRAALAYLAAQPEIDDKRIGLIGYSFGATVSAEVASGALRALALVSPPLGFSDLRVAWGCPALVVGGEGDPIAPADRLRVVAQAPGVELRLVPGADHSWWGHEDELGEALGEFVARHLA